MPGPKTLQLVGAQNSNFHTFHSPVGSRVDIRLEADPRSGRDIHYRGRLEAGSDVGIMFRLYAFLPFGSGWAL